MRSLFLNLRLLISFSHRVQNSCQSSGRMAFAVVRHARLIRRRPLMATPGNVFGAALRSSQHGHPTPLRFGPSSRGCRQYAQKTRCGLTVCPSCYQQRACLGCGDTLACASPSEGKSRKARLGRAEASRVPGLACHGGRFSRQSTHQAHALEHRSLRVQAGWCIARTLHRHARR